MYILKSCILYIISIYTANNNSEYNFYSKTSLNFYIFSNTLSIKDIDLILLNTNRD